MEQRLFGNMKHKKGHRMKSSRYHRKKASKTPFFYGLEYRKAARS